MLFVETLPPGDLSIEEQINHINYLKLKAVLLGLRSLCCTFNEKHILVQSDNTTAVAKINAMRVLNHVIWQSGHRYMGMVYKSQHLAKCHPNPRVWEPSSG